MMSSKPTDAPAHELLADLAGLGVWDLDCRTATWTASPACRAQLGIDTTSAASAPSHRTLEDFLPADDRARLRSALDACLRTGTELDIEFRVARHDAGQAWVRMRGRIERDAAGDAVRLLGVSQDVTRERFAQDRARVLLELSDAFNRIEQPADIAYAAAEALGRALGVSRAGYGTVDLVRETITVERDWNAPGIRTIAGMLHFREHGSYIDDLQQGTTVVIADAEKDPRTAATADVLKAISAQSFINMPVTESEGLVALLYLNHAEARSWSADELAFVREVAHHTRVAVQRREAELQLKALASTLEAQVQERTSALMRVEEALRQSQKMEAIGQLTGGIAHDFNNLLAGIGASLEILDRRIGQGRMDDAPRYIAAARGSVRRAASLTQRLLAFARRQTLVPQAVDANRLVTGMEELIRRSVGPGVTIDVVGAVGLWPVQVDPAQLENSLLNLCINGRDAMAPDGGRLVIETANKWLDDRTARERDIPPGQYISLCVTDTGQGMSPEVAARAFDPFFTTKPLGEGTGLGLSMVYGFVRQSGGEVRIYSELGKGTTVCLYLPRHIGSVDEAPAPTEHEIEAGDGEIILVIEDERTIRDFLVEDLREGGYSVLEAEDGPSGLRVLQAAGRIDLLITDVGLPGGMNGRQVADAARIARPGLKTLFITGFADNAAVGDGKMEAGMEVMTKPFDLVALTARIRSMLDR